MLISCGDDSTSPDGGGGGGGLTLAVSVSSGTKPTYTWPGGGAAHSVSVMRVSAPTTIVWGIAAPMSQAITSPVVHGTIPAGALPSANTEPTLTAGVAYRVSVTLGTGQTGFKDFTP
jgi:hypothetical protein